MKPSLTLTRKPIPKARTETDTASPASAMASAIGERVAIERVWPEIDAGRFAVKRTVGDVLTVEADIFCEGHDQLGAALLYRLERDRDWHEVPMHPIDNDRWRGEIPLEINSRYLYTIIAWRDLFSSWRDEVIKKHAANRAVSLELFEGRSLIEKAIADGTRGSDNSRRHLEGLLEVLEELQDEASSLKLLTSENASQLMARVGQRSNLSR
jgi:starch synthase (maltosyl-transferring)